MDLHITSNPKSNSSHLNSLLFSSNFLNSKPQSITKIPLFFSSSRKARPCRIWCAAAAAANPSWQDAAANLLDELADESTNVCDEIEHLVSLEKFEDAIALFEASATADTTPLRAATYDSLVTACAGVASGKAAKTLLRHMDNAGFVRDQGMWQRVLEMCLRCRLFPLARRTFVDMPRRDADAWEALVAGLAEAGECDEALDVFLMQWEELPDTAVGLLVPAIAAAGLLGSVDIGRQLHSCITKVGLYDDTDFACALIDMYGKCGRVEEAQLVFDEMADQNVTAWNSLIAGYNVHGDGEEALDMYHGMQQCGAGADQFTYAVVTRICSRLGLWEHARQVHAALIRHGFALDIDANTALVELYCKWGKMEDARNVFEKMPRKNVASWNALIAGYAEHGMGGEAIKMFERMETKGLGPNDVTHLAALNACAYSGFVDKAKQIFESMTRYPRTKPRAVHYVSMIELFGRQGRLDEAFSMIKMAPFKPPVNMWAALLTACRIHKNLQIARFAAEKLLALNPEKVSNYFVLANLYKSSGRLDDAMKVLKVVRRMGLKLLPTSSLIEVEKQTHEFFIGRKFHPRSDEIYRKIDVLMEEIKEVGYVPEEDDLLPDFNECEQEFLKIHHSERLAIAFGLISTPDFTPLRVVQSHRLCSDCHKAIKFVSLVSEREIVVRDASRLHRFKCGTCSCGDYW